MCKQPMLCILCDIHILVCISLRLSLCYIRSCAVGVLEYFTKICLLRFPQYYCIFSWRIIFAMRICNNIEGSATNNVGVLHTCMYFSSSLFVLHTFLCCRCMHGVYYTHVCISLRLSLCYIRSCTVGVCMVHSSPMYTIYLVLS
jgi:hypothetical protein